MRRSTLAVDFVIALVAMIVLVVVSPGLAVVGLIAVLVLVFCGLSFLFDFWRSRRRSQTRPPARGPGRPPGRPARRL